MYVFRVTGCGQTDQPGTSIDGTQENQIMPNTMRTAWKFIVAMSRMIGVGMILLAI
jgi:hypothetical protein